MAAEDDDKPRKKITHEIGQDLSLLSVGVVEDRLAMLSAEIERLKSEIAERLGFQLIGHKLELYGVAIEGAEPSKREGLIFTRHAARVDPADVDAG